MDASASKIAMDMDAMNSKKRNPIFKLAAQMFVVFFVLCVAVGSVAIYCTLPDEMISIGTQYFSVTNLVKSSIFAGFILGAMYTVAFQSFNRMIRT